MPVYRFYHLSHRLSPLSGCVCFLWCLALTLVSAHPLFVSAQQVPAIPLSAASASYTSVHPEPVQPVVPFRFSDIRLEGLKRVQANRVFANLTLALNRLTTQDDLLQTADKLFATGLFDDIQFRLDQDILVIVLQERPLIRDIYIRGNQLIATETLTSVMADSGLKQGAVFQRDILDKIIAELQVQYNLLGRYGTQVAAEVVPYVPVTEKQQDQDTPVAAHAVVVRIVIQEAAVITIGDIAVIGNQQVSEKELLAQMQLKRNTSAPWYSSSDRYSKEKLNGDLERIKSYYLDRGFINFTIASVQVSITPDKSQIYITIHVNEGRRHTLRQVDLIGDFRVAKSLLQEQLDIQPGDIYAQTRVLSAKSAIEDKLYEYGYSQARVNIITNLHPEDHSVVLRFSVNPGQRVYVRRISFRGNLRTADSVLRRELRQLEGAVYSIKDIRQSKLRLERLGFFSSVAVETLPVQGVQDQVDLLFVVEEEFFGSISGGLQYSSFSGTSITFGYSEKNVFGSGKDAAIDLSLGGIRQNLDFSLLDRYFTLDGVSLNYRLFFSEIDYDKASLSNFNTDEYGGSLTLGYPLSENASINLGLAYEVNNVTLGTEPVQDVEQFIRLYGNRYQELGLSASYNYSSLNRGILPTKGSKRVLSAFTSVPASDLDYYRLVFTERDYMPLDQDHHWIMMLRGTLGYADSYKSTHLPFFKHFYAGGLNTLRNYAGNSLGTRGLNQDGTQGSRLGGNLLFSTSLDVIFPLDILTGVKNFRSSLFVEGAGLFTTDCIIDSPYCDEGVDLNDLRYTAGLTFSWFSPVGPMTLSLGTPLNARQGDETETLQFILGGSL